MSDHSRNKIESRDLVVTEFYDGQGLGNQLWLYVATRCKAKQLGVNFGIKSPEKFKGFELFDLNFGEQIFGGTGPEGGPPEELPDGISFYFRETLIRHPETKQDITTYSDEWNSIAPSTKIDGNFQGEGYIEDYKEEIREWLRVSDLPLESHSDEDLCIINFRGGEYKSVEEIYLPKQYWDNARSKMLSINPNMKFKVVTDDVVAARDFFDKKEISSQNMRQDYIDVHTAKYSIIANTSFAWFPSWLNTNLKYCIAPKFWWGYNNAKYWACGYNLTRDFHYLDKQGDLWNFEKCLNELEGNISIGIPEKSKPLPEPSAISARIFDPKIKSRAKTEIKKYIPKFLVKYVRMSQAFINRQRISLLNERIDPLFYFGESVAKVLESHQGLVYDSFYFFNELDILEIRLEVLNDYVDKFVIIESDRTFSGKKKESIYSQNKARYEKFESKIIHYWIENSPFDRDSVTSVLHDSSASQIMKRIALRTLNSKNVPLGPGNEHWTTEAFQKESLHLALSDLKNEDIVFVSDVDEIWNPQAKMRFNQKSIYIFKQIPYLYKLNNRSNEHWHNWTGSMMSTYEKIRDSCINDMRTHGRLPRIRILFGGWHFSFQSNADGIIEKLKSYGHQEINTPAVISGVEKSLEENLDLRGRGAKFRKSDSGLPPFILSNRKKFSKLFID